MFKYILLVVGLFICVTAQTQDLKQRITIQFAETTLENALFDLMDHEQVPLIFNNNLIPNKSINASFNGYDLGDILDFLLDGTGLSYRVAYQSIFIEEDTSKPIVERYVSGRVLDQESGESIIGATVYIPSLQQGTYTNEYGQFSLLLPEGEWQLFFSYIGYQEQQFSLNLEQDTTFSVEMPYSLLLDPITLWDTVKSKGLHTPIDWNLEKLDLKAINLLPRFGGEADIIRSTHLLPGVQSGPDGIGGIFVRGGNSGHNLITVDGVPVYNVNHAAGLLSIFNPDVIKTAKFLKGAYPARYEGRLASVLDIRTRDGNYNNFGGKLDIGLLSGRAMLEGPLTKGDQKSSFLIAGRVSLINQFLEPRIRSYKRTQGEDGSSTYNFYDFNAKINYQLSPKNSLYLSLYKGSDDFDNFGEQRDNFNLVNPNTGLTVPFRLFQEYQEEVSWGNDVVALRWNSEIKPNLFANTTLTYSALNLKFGYALQDSLLRTEPLQILNFGLDAGWYQSSIQDMAMKVDFDWHPGMNHYVRFGLKGGNIRFQPGTLRYNAASLENAGNGFTQNRPIHSNEVSVYAENSQQIRPNLSVNYGVHLSSFFVGEEDYWLLQPRFSLFWQAGQRIAFNASARKTSQFLHLLGSSAIGLPTDLWVPSTDKIHPEEAIQFAVGTHLNLSAQFKLQVEAYHKQMSNLLSFSEGITFIDDWETNVAAGEGEAYGIDVSLQKTSGATTGWISYSYAFTNRTFDRINFGNTFPFKYDRRHDLKIAAIHSFSDRFNITANFLFGTGLAFSLPDQNFTFQLPGSGSIPINVLDFGSKNQYRFPYYHRLDLGANYRFSGRGLQYHLYAGLTNIYNRANPLYYRLSSEVGIQNGQLTQFKRFVGVQLLPILPSVNFSV
ncbi:MAG: TonB-dependent receptor, partial [Bacteroidota bacterium]